MVGFAHCLHQVQCLGVIGDHHDALTRLDEGEGGGDGDGGSSSGDGGGGDSDDRCRSM